MAITRTMRTRSAAHPSALQELPLQHFLPAPGGPPRAAAQPCTSMVPQSACKRVAHSPALLSPAKRRILAYEGVLPSSPKCARSSGPHIDRAHFDALLCGPDSPARQLDFGHASADAKTPKPAADVDATPRRRSERVQNRLAPSPKLKASSNPSSSRVVSCSPSTSCSRRSSPPPERSAYIPRMIPRELPQALDPRSVHHPGFDVHVDTHIPLPHVHDRLRLLPLPDADVEMAELEKENTPLRVRRSKKAGILELDALSGALPSPRKGGMPRFRVRAGTDVRFSTFAAVMEEVDALPGTRDAALSPARTPKDRKAARQMLEEEVDEADGEEL